MATKITNDNITSMDAGKLTGTVVDSQIDGLNASKLTGSLPAMSGASLTGITAGPTVSASDPTITTNASLGTQWANSSTGDFYILTDATTNENIWSNVGSNSGDILPYAYGASTTVYKAGGHGSSGTDSIEAISVSSDGSSTDISNLSVAGGSFSGHSDTPHAYGYFAGGNQGRTNQIDRFQYATTNDATDVGDLATAGRSGDGSESTTHGYVTSGGAGRTNIITKFAFGSSSSDASVGILTHSPTSNNVGHSTQTNGYQAGGKDSTNGNIINKYSHTSDGDANDIGNLTYAGYGMKGSSSTTHGYTSGGYRTGAGYFNIIDRHSFSSDGNASDWADLSRSPDSPGSGSSTTHGYNFGGHNGSGFTTDIDKFPFASQTIAADIGNLQWGAYAPKGVNF